MPFLFDVMRFRIRALFLCLCFLPLAGCGGSKPSPLANTIITDVDARIEGKSFEMAAPLWSSLDPVSQTYVRNKASWLHGVDMTCISVWNSVIPRYCATVITPDAVIGAQHASCEVGSRVRFVDAENRSHTRQIIAISNPATDIWIGLLDSPLPASVKPARCLPKIMPGLPMESKTMNSWRVPVCGINQRQEATIADCFNVTPDWQPVRKPIDPKRRLFYRQLVAGDSGWPYFLLINNEAVLLGCWYKVTFAVNISLSGSVLEAVGGGPAVQYYQDEINASLKKLGSKYTLQTIAP